MLSVVLIGTGNVAHHLLGAISRTSTQIVQVFGRNAEALQKISGQIKTTQNFEEVVDADVYIIAVSDGSIKEVSEFLKHKNGLVVHTSGSMPIHELQSKRCGVFYPLQTFSKEFKVDFSNIPICIEAQNYDDLETLKKMASQLSNAVYEVPSEKRKKLHLAAVFANNFSNHLYQIALEICEEEDISFELMKPLIMETANKIRFLAPEDAQTGPARRNDLLTMQEHLGQLKNAVHKKIYQVMSESIQKVYEKKL